MCYDNVRSLNYVRTLYVIFHIKIGSTLNNYYTPDYIIQLQYNYVNMYFAKSSKLYFS